MPTFIADSFDGETLAQTITVEYVDLSHDVLVQLALGGDKGAMDFLSKRIMDDAQTSTSTD